MAVFNNNVLIKTSKMEMIQITGFRLNRLPLRRYKILL